MLDWLIGPYAGWQSPESLLYQHNEDYRRWCAEVHPMTSRQVYFDMLKERNHATRLEF